MTSKSYTFLALFLSINLLFSLVTACGDCPNLPKPKPKPTPPSMPCAPPKTKPTPSPTPTKPTPSPAPTKPNPTPSPAPSCPRDALKLGVCADLLGLVNVVIGTPPVKPCCTLIQGLADLEAAVCLCTAIKANVLGINLNIPVSLSLLLNVCGKKVPSDFQCA